MKQVVKEPSASFNSRSSRSISSRGAGEEHEEASGNPATLLPDQERKSDREEKRSIDQQAEERDLLKSRYRKTV